jgi:4-amino-4-deoxy-L-arabinose transferase-like glycosyltransferase
MNAGGNQGPPLDAGRPGLLRLAAPRVAAQVAWLLPFALVGSAFAFFRRRLRLPLDAEQPCILLCAGWALAFMAVFSLSRGAVHTYYTVEIAPALAALSGISAVHLRRMADASGWRGLVLPAVLALAAAWQIPILRGSPHWRVPLVIAILAGIIAAILLKWQRRLLPATVTGLAALLLCPAVWCWTAVRQPSHPGLPAAGPDLRLEPRPADEWERGGIDATVLVNFLRIRASGERILLAATSAQITNGIIVDTGAPVIAMGGFLGTDRAMSLDRLRCLIANRELRSILIAPFDRIAGDRERTEWVRRNCDIVPAKLWRGAGARQEASDLPVSFGYAADPLLLARQLAGPGALVQLFDCAAE